jgi:hypothetical protein
LLLKQQSEKTDPMPFVDIQESDFYNQFHS